MPKKDNDDVDPTLPKWGPTAKGWHTLLYMLQQGMVKMVPLAEGGEAPAVVRGLSKYFKYPSTRFSTNLGTMRKNCIESPQTMFAKIDEKMVDEKILKGAGAPTEDDDFAKDFSGK